MKAGFTEIAFGVIVVIVTSSCSFYTNSEAETTILSPTAQPVEEATLILVSPGFMLFVRRENVVPGITPYKDNIPVLTITLLPGSKFASTLDYFMEF